MGQTKELYIDKIIEIILGLIFIFQGNIMLGAALLTFGLITIKVTLS